MTLLQDPGTQWRKLPTLKIYTSSSANKFFKLYFYDDTSKDCSQYQTPQDKAMRTSYLQQKHKLFNYNTKVVFLGSHLPEVLFGIGHILTAGAYCD